MIESTTNMRILLAFSLSMCVLATEFAPGVIVPESSAPVVPKDRGLSSLLARTRSIPECVKKAATVVLDFHADGSKVSSMAKQVIADTATLATAELVIDAFDALDLAPRHGIEITNDCLDELRGEKNASGKIVRMEEEAKGAFQGDMMPFGAEQLDLWQRRAAGELIETEGKPSYGGTAWPKGIIKYCFSSSVTKSVKDAWAKSIEQFKKATPFLQFKDVGWKSEGNGRGRVLPGISFNVVNGNAMPNNPGGASCNEYPALFVKSNENGCWTCVGYPARFAHSEGVTYAVNLGPGCDSIGTTMHETGHVLGMDHEQSRPDRDKYVTIHKDQIDSEGKGQFEIAKNGDVSRAYDVLSLMHYGVQDFAIGSQPTMTVTNKGYEKYTTNPSGEPISSACLPCVIDLMPGCVGVFMLDSSCNVCNVMCVLCVDLQISPSISQETGGGCPSTMLTSSKIYTRQRLQERKPTCFRVHPQNARTGMVVR